MHVFKNLLNTFTFLVVLLGFVLPISSFGQDIQESSGTEGSDKEDMDIVLAIDVSSSMKVEDVMPTRLEAVKSAAQQLMSVHPTARYGVVLFAGEAMVYAPLGDDSLDLYQMLEQITIDLVEGTGTVIGEAIDLSIKEFERTGSNNRKVIIFSDGATSEEKDIFKSVLRLAAKRKIEVYAVGVGTEGEGTITTPDQEVITIKAPYNDESLRVITLYTNGKYFHAESLEEMNTISEEISMLLNIKENE